MTWKDKNVLITGDTHFVGGHLAEKLVMLGSNVKAFIRYDYQNEHGSLVGLLLNFGERSLAYRRILPPKKVTQHHINRQWLFVPEHLSLDNDRNESV